MIKDLVEDGSYTAKNKIINEKEFIDITHGLVLDNALLDLSLGRFETAKVGIKKYLKDEPESAKGYHYLAEAYMQQYEQPKNKRLKDTESKEEQKQKAIEYYHQAIKLNSEFALPYKALGIMYFREGKKREAKENLNKYLKLNPDADDYTYIKNYLQRINEINYE